MEGDLHRHDITDRAWKIIEPHPPGKRGDWGGVAKDNRLFTNAVTWILRTGAPWRDLPRECGGWKNTQRRFCRWRDKGIREKRPEAVIDEPDFEWPMIDAPHVKAHKHACGAEGGSQGIGRTKGGSTPRSIRPWMRLACRCESLSRRVLRRIARLLRNSWGALRRMR